MMKPFILIFIFIIQSAFSEPLGRILETQTGKNISPNELVEALSRAEIVLIGEQHDNLKHHEAQEWLLQQTANQRGSVILEMLVPEQEALLGEMQTYLLNGGSTGKRSLAEKINWNMSWDWSQYQSLIYTLLHQKALLLAGSPSRKDLAQQTQFIPSGTNAGNPAVRQSLTALMDTHHGEVKHLVAMQQYKDFKMSTVLLNAPKPAWLIAGNIHVSKQLGVPLFLRDAGFTGNVKILLLTETGSEVDGHHADFIWFFN